MFLPRKMNKLFNTLVPLWICRRAIITPKPWGTTFPPKFFFEFSLDDEDGVIEFE